LALAFFTLLVILALYRFFTGFLATVAVLIGLVVGTAAGAAFGFTDFSRVADAAIFGVTTPFHFGVPTFNAAAIISLMIIMLITMVETTGDVFACGEIVDKKVGKEDVARAIRADGLSTMLGGILNSFPYTCFAENVGLVRLTGVRSRWVVATAGLFMMIIGVFPKVGAIVAAIPYPVLGGAGFALFGTVAVVGIQTLRRVDFHDERNVIILAISLAMAIAPTVYPTLINNFPDAVRIIISSGITLGSVTAILLNLLFNVWGRDAVVAPRAAGVPPPEPRLTLDEVNRMDRNRFVATFGALFQGQEWVAERAFAARPFSDVAALRAALHEALFSASPEDQLALIRSYPDLGRVFDSASNASQLSVVDQAMAGLDRLDTNEHHSLQGLTSAYRERFGFPLIIAVRENSKDSILEQGNRRLHNSPTAEQAAAVVEIVKIANLRLRDRVAEPESETVLS
jgi:OHCU decarboxylase